MAPTGAPTELISLSLKGKPSASTREYSWSSAHTLEMVALSKKIRTLPIKQLKVEDTTVPRASTGTSVMVALLLEAIRQLDHHRSLTQLHNFAHVLLTTHPDSLLKLYKQPSKLVEFTSEVTLKTPLPPFVKDKLCPAMVPRVVKDVNLRQRIVDISLT